MSKPTYSHAGKLALYEKIVATIPELERKGAANPYTSVNGNMFSIMSPAGSLALRLSDEDCAAFLKKHDTRLYEAYGVVMKEYVVVPDYLLENTKELKRYFERSYQYAQSLKAKPTTKSAKEKSTKKKSVAKKK